MQTYLSHNDRGANTVSTHGSINSRLLRFLWYVSEGGKMKKMIRGSGSREGEISTKLLVEKVMEIPFRIPSFYS